MVNIIDKRFLPKNQTSGSRQKFIDRYKNVIKQNIKNIIGKESIKDFGKGAKKIKIKREDLNEPSFEFAPGTGNTDRIYIGNKSYHKGQRIKRSPNNGGKGGGGNSGNGEQDDFEFILTEEEYSNLFFEDLALPDLIKKQFTGKVYEIKHAGYSRYGGPSSLNIKKTMLNALGRRLALRAMNPHLRHLSDEELGKLTNPANSLPKVRYIEDSDLRYNFKDKVEQPSVKAVMFCLMDVSGSMGEVEKDIAKRFFILLNLFLKRSYSVVDVVFVRHTEIAEEVDEKTFFYDRTSGGTMISSGYQKIIEIQEQRYNSEDWNIYVAQVSDGDNYTDDNDIVKELLITKILPKVQYFAYIKVGDNNPYGSELTKIMKGIMDTYKNFQARVIQQNSQIFEVFRSLFKKKER